jgi:hypothetical protein
MLVFKGESSRNRGAADGYTADKVALAILPLPYLSARDAREAHKKKAETALSTDHIPVSLHFSPTESYIGFPA